MGKFLSHTITDHKSAGRRSLRVHHIGMARCTRAHMELMPLQGLQVQILSRLGRRDHGMRKVSWGVCGSPAGAVALRYDRQLFRVAVQGRAAGSAELWKCLSLHIWSSEKSYKCQESGGRETYSDDPVKVHFQSRKWKKECRTFAFKVGLNPIAEISDKL